jgi:hypothetical protein
VWAKKQPELIDPGTPSISSGRAYFYLYMPETKEWQVLYHNLSDLGYEPRPAIAWDSPPRVPENPLNNDVIIKQGNK